MGRGGGTYQCWYLVGTSAAVCVGVRVKERTSGKGRVCFLILVSSDNAYPAKVQVRCYCPRGVYWLTCGRTGMSGWRWQCIGFLLSQNTTGSAACELGPREIHGRGSRTEVDGEMRTKINCPRAL